MKMFKKTMWIGFAVSLLGLFVAVSSARADEWDKRTTLTFSQPVEIPRHVLPAGTYIFALADANDRHVVRVFSADGKKVIATFLTIPDYRLKATKDTVIKFKEVARGQPEAIRAWFYPGRTIGEEFVYHKRRAKELAVVAKVAVPAHDVEEDVTLEALPAAPIVAVTPEEKEVPVAAAIYGFRQMK